MSRPFLSVGRYNATDVQVVYASDLFAKQNDTLNPEETVPRLLEDFKRLFDQTQDPSNNLHDTIITCNKTKGSVVYAQRQLLMARSAYFENLFSENSTPNGDYDIEGKKDGILSIIFKDEFYPGLDVTLLRELVTYMYWGYWESKNLERTKQLFEISSIFDLKELRNNTEEELAKNLNPRNAAEFLVSAEEYGGKHLKKKSIDFIILNKHKIDAEHLEDRLLKVNDGARLIAEIYQQEVFSTKKNTI